MNNLQGVSAHELFRSIRIRLGEAYIPGEARQLAALLLEYFAGMDLKQIIAYPDTVLEPAQLKKISDAVERLLRHEPLQHITGFAHFCGNEFRVNPNVLIPRPETEELVRWVLEDHAGKHHLSIADIGTGSGCIAISLWLRFQDAEVHAYDISTHALRLAVQNNIELGAGVEFHSMDFLNPEQWPSREFDIIISNPPYIPLKYRQSLPANVAACEPAIALFVPDDDPLIFYRMLAEFGATSLSKGAHIYAELHERFGAEAAAMFNNSGFCEVEVRNDIHGKTRMLRAIR